MPELMKCGGVRKYIVLPLKYVGTPYYEEAIEMISEEVAEDRVKDGKEPYPEYIVINTDEPYIQEIIDVLKKHNHWGAEAPK